MPATKISINNAKTEKLFYFVATAVIYRKSDGRCLVLKRSMREKVHPGRYAVPGGKLEWKDLAINNPTRVNGDVLDYENEIGNLLAREVKEEAGLEIDSKLHYLDNVVFIRPDETPVVLVKFAALYKSGEVVLEKDAFDDFRWVNAEEIKTLEYIDGIDMEVAKTISLFQAWQLD